MIIHRLTISSIAAALLVCLFLWSESAQAQDTILAPAHVQVHSDRTSLEPGESCQAILTLHNTAPFTLTSLTAHLHNTQFTVVTATRLAGIVPPYTDVETLYTLQAQTAGSHNIIIRVQYAWVDPVSGVMNRRSETVTADSIDVVEPPGFDYPEYLIPLVIGFVFSHLSVVLVDWFKQHKEKRKEEEQVRGVVLALLDAAQQSLGMWKETTKERVHFDLWQEAIVKGDLYPALERLARRTGYPDLLKELAELSVLFFDYNERKMVTEEMNSALKKKVAELSRTIRS